MGCHVRGGCRAAYDWAVSCAELEMQPTSVQDSGDPSSTLARAYGEDRSGEAPQTAMCGSVAGSFGLGLESPLEDLDGARPEPDASAP